jgi:VWFA-related protein
MLRYPLLVLVTLSAVAGDKPALVFSGPASCPASRRGDRCEEFLETMQHPAIARRLDAIDFRRVDAPAGDEPSLAVLDAKGDAAVRWYDVPDRRVLGKILNVIDTAMPYLDAADPYDPPLAALALGNEVRGRALLTELRGSPDAEARELATIWLGKLDDRKQKSSAHAAFVAALSKNGSTPRVRFEAWMETARLHAESDRVREAAAAVEAAAEAASSPEERRIALLTRQYLEERRSSIIGVGYAGELVYGRRTLQPRGVPKTAARVELRLDGRLAATSKKAPFATTIDFGRVPKRQVLELTALDRGGNVVQRASVVVNERSSASSIEIAQSASEVSASVRAPRGAIAEEVRFEWNGAAIATFTKPPYRAALSAGDEAGVLRAVARFDDGTEVEDVRLRNSAGTLTSDVHLVEVPVYFETRASEVNVRESGKPRRVERVVPAAEAPLRLALVLDASSSMVPHMLDLQEAALRFVEENLDARDETMVVGFGASVDVLRPTRDRAVIERTVLGLRAAGATPLNDALIQALLDLQVGGSRRALVVFSDGLDTSSVFGAADVEEVARRVGVPIYVLSFLPPVMIEGPRTKRQAVMQPSNAEIVQRAQRGLASLAERSGGKSFRLRSLDGLGEIWNEIGADLRKQSLVLFRTEPGAEDEWRTLEISAKTGGALRAPAGVFVTGRGAE